MCGNLDGFIFCTEFGCPPWIEESDISNYCVKVLERATTMKKYPPSPKSQEEPFVSVCLQVCECLPKNFFDSSLSLGIGIRK